VLSTFHEWHKAHGALRQEHLPSIVNALVTSGESVLSNADALQRDHIQQLMEAFIDGSCGEVDYQRLISWAFVDDDPPQQPTSIKVIRRLLAAHLCHIVQVCTSATIRNHTEQHSDTQGHHADGWIRFLEARDGSCEEHTAGTINGPCSRPKPCPLNLSRETREDSGLQKTPHEDTGHSEATEDHSVQSKRFVDLEIELANLRDSMAHLAANLPRS